MCRVTGVLMTNERTISSSSGSAGSIVLEEGSFSWDGGPPRRLARVTIRAAREEDAARLRETLSETCGIGALAPLGHDGLFQLLALQPPDLVGPGPQTVRADLSTGEAALALVRGHDMRVAVRRLRAAIQLYEPFLPPDIGALREPLRWAGNCLGAVRDLDVQQERLRERQETLSPGDAALLDPILAALASRRARRHEELLDALASDSYRRIVAALSTAVARETTRAADVPVPLVAPAIVHEAARRFRKRRRALTKDSPAGSFHELRIRGKVLRYALEFHRSVYREPAEALVEDLTDLQDLLGAHQDANVAEDWFLSELENTTGPTASKTAFLLGRLAERSRDEARELRARVMNERDPSTGRAWRRLERRMEREYHRVLRRAHGRKPLQTAQEP
jgi:CHAD domain-containing protein